jgi:hypothetical protein
MVMKKNINTSAKGYIFFIHVYEDGKRECLVKTKGMRHKKVENHKFISIVSSLTFEYSFVMLHVWTFFRQVLF